MILSMLLTALLSRTISGRGTAKKGARKEIQAVAREVAERRGSRTHQARLTHLAGFEVRALHRKRCLSIADDQAGARSYTSYPVARSLS